MLVTFGEISKIFHLLNDFNPALQNLQNIQNDLFVYIFFQIDFDYQIAVKALFQIIICFKCINIFNIYY